MLGIPISQLTPTTDLQPSDQIPLARGGLSNATRRMPGTAIVSTASNIGTGTGVFAQKNLTTLQFYSLSCLTNDININLVNNTIVLSLPQNIKTVNIGDSITTTYSVANAATSNVNDFRIDLDGVSQEPGESFTLSGTNIVFTSPPLSGTRIVMIYKAN
jgi:hypothetical protein